jgi:putative toxin-antitoxin system antitoxin component (TIGR02293 family)
MSRSENDRLRTVFKRAVEVFGDEEKARQWLDTPIPALQYATPLFSAYDDESEKEVLAILERIEYGVYW